MISFKIGNIFKLPLYWPTTRLTDIAEEDTINPKHNKCTIFPGICIICISDSTHAHVIAAANPSNG